MRDTNKLSSTPKGTSSGQVDVNSFSRLNQKSSFKAYDEPMPRTYACDMCCRTFGSSGGLYKHKKTVHGRDEDLIPCPYCDNKFCTQSALKRHLPKHSSERPHVCDLCGRSYKHKDALMNHPCNYNS